MIKNVFFLVNESKQPIRISINLFNLLIGLTLWFNRNTIGLYIINITIITLIISIYNWTKEIKYESTIRGSYTNEVHKVLTEGYLLFLLSEIMIFVSLFLSYFYSSFNISVTLNKSLFPKGIYNIDYLSIPLFNTILLFLSSITITISLNLLINGNKNLSLQYLFITISLNIVFTTFQAFEYFYSLNDISDGLYPSYFFFITGIHGLHVIIASLMCIINYKKLYCNEFTLNQSLFFNCTSLYVHIVDLIWLFVYLFLYILI